MAIIDARGLVNDGSPNLEVEGTAQFRGGLNVTGTIAGLMPGSLGVTSLTAQSNTLTTPGLYRFTSTAAGITASLPSAATNPGSIFAFSSATGADTRGIMLTGSAVVGNFVFAAASASLGAGAAPVLEGAKLIVSAAGSVVLMSDAIRWLRVTSSGSISLSAT